MALFSKLAAETTIPPHNGLLNTRLICHLPIIVPENCGALRVGNEERRWVEGEMLIFDDSIEHAAWNKSKHERVILLFEVWRPELSADERELITMMLKAVAEYSETRGRA
jgi:aspartyl/asparaginyl beta-hydroxylase (cupin superfamily)